MYQVKSSGYGQQKSQDAKRFTKLGGLKTSGVHPDKPAQMTDVGQRIALDAERARLR